MKVETIVENGTIVTADAMSEANLLISEGSIVGVVAPETPVEAGRRIDATGKLVMPGVVDPHVHVAGPGTIDTYKTGSTAAALGGVTTFITFAWQGWGTNQEPWDEPGTLPKAVDRQLEWGAESIVDFGLHGTITREADATLAELSELVDRGVSSFKLFTAYDWGLSNGYIERVFEELSALEAVAVVHTEDRSVCQTREAVMREAGDGEATSYPDARPGHAEAMALDGALRLARETGVNYYGFHTSSRSAMDVIKHHRTDGSTIRAETCSHYLTLDRTAYERQGMLPVLAPPLRTPDDNDAMFEALREGVLDVVSTDHVAFTRAAKESDDWWDSEYGANSVQRSLPVFHDEAVIRRDHSYPFLVRKLCTNPARTFGLVNKGTLDPGTDADFVLFDPDRTQTIDPTDNASKADYSVYEGREVAGTVSATYVRGKRVAADGEIVADPGHGKFVGRDPLEWSD